MNDKEFDKLIQKALNNTNELPEGLSDRLEQQIDRWAAEESNIRRNSPERKRVFYWIGGIAASFLLAMFLFFQVENKPEYPVMADTFSDPKEAALVAQNTLMFLSAQLNKGLNQVSETGKEVDKINEIVIKQLETLNIQSENN